MDVPHRLNATALSCRLMLERYSKEYLEVIKMDFFYNLKTFYLSGRQPQQKTLLPDRHTGRLAAGCIHKSNNLYVTIGCKVVALRLQIHRRHNGLL